MKNKYICFRIVGLLSLFGGFIGILTGVLFTYPKWYMHHMDAQIDHGPDPGPYISPALLRYSLDNLSVGLLVFGVIFACLLPRSGFQEVSRLRWGMVLGTFLIVSLLVALPLVQIWRSAPQTVGETTGLKNLVDEIITLCVFVAPLLVAMELLTLLAGRLLQPLVGLGTAKISGHNDT